MREGIAVTRRQVLKTCAAACGLLLAAPMINRGRFQAFAQSNTEYSARAIDLVASTLVIDMLSALGVSDHRAERWYKSPDGFTATDFEWLRSSGVRVHHLGANTISGRGAREHAYKQFAKWNALLVEHGAYLTRITRPDDFKRLQRDGKVGLILGLQNSEHFRTVDDVDAFWVLGQRVSQITHNDGNPLGSGGMDWHDGGLTDYGAEIIGRMNQVGMTVDVSHCGDRTTLDAIAASSRPVAITHSNCRVLNPDYPRCKTDEAIRKMAAGGGVMGLTVYRAFVRGEDPTTIEHWLDHVDHVAKLVGVEHVGIGSDADIATSGAEGMKFYNGLPRKIKRFYRFRKTMLIDELDHPKRIYDITEGLLRRGYNDADIQGILGHNFKRMLAQTWLPRSVADADEPRPGALGSRGRTKG